MPEEREEVAGGAGEVNMTVPGWEGGRVQPSRTVVHEWGGGRGEGGGGRGGEGDRKAWVKGTVFKPRQDG